ncbi:Regulator of nonsense transcripts 2 [Hypsibius exemplaris]|uniref:Regulator of nonsense transcripts 2 n=1 Tax=Hypsibius exemplaris TaxID=2072580 RepID=A0A1W0WJW7_HYPEX|nr:Regulator of nonsense transcripts 2 [Hypsibius exemplaris]
MANIQTALVSTDDAEERKKMDEYEESLKSLAETRARQRKLNLSVQYPEEDFYSTLDSKLKSCTGYIKKLKILTESQRDILDKDFQGLNLTRYVSEATQALAEAKLKLSDVPIALEVCTLFHRRYPDFASAMMESWRKVLPLHKGDIVSNPSKLRVDLRLLPEQIAMGLLPTKPSVQLLCSLLQVLLESDKEDRALMPLLTGFAKAYGFEFMGIHPKKLRMLVNEYPGTFDFSSVNLFSADFQNSMRNIFVKYYAGVTKQLESENQRLRDLEKAHRRLLDSRGDVPQEKVDKYEIHVAAFNKLKTAVLSLADYLDQEMPELAPKEEVDDNKTTIELLTVEFGDRAGLAPIWNDEDERDFYEILPDLKATMPSMAYKDSLKDVETSATASISEDALSILDAAIEADSAQLLLAGTATNLDEPSEPSSANLVSPSRPEETASDQTLIKRTAESGHVTRVTTAATPVKKSITQQKRPYIKNSKSKGLADLLDTVWEGDECDGEDEPAVLVDDEQDTSTSALLRQILDTFILGLSKVTSKEGADKMAIDFCTNLNRRHYRKKLVQAFYNVPRTRADLLPLYSRIVAVLNPVMPDVGGDLCEALRRQFRWLVRRQDPLRLESKIRNVRFMAELTKFGIFSKAECLLCLKILLNNFKHHAVEMACCLLESGGRFLYWSPDSHSRMKILLEELLRRKSLRLFDARMDSMIENAYFSCSTPETAARRTGQNMTIKIRTPMQMFIRKIFLDDLNRTDPSDVTCLTSLIRRLPWDDPEVFEYGLKYLSSAWRINYASISALANVLAGLANYQDDLAVRVVDNVLDDIRVQLELNNSKFNQRRLAMVRYLGEMYNYRIVDSSVIFNTLFSLILFGWIADVPTMLDPPSHLLRIRLVCALLNTCGEYFSHGTARRRLDSFLALFRRYFWMKRENVVWSDHCPFPMTIVHLVEDTMGKLRRDFSLLKNLEEAEAALKKINDKMLEKVNMDSFNAALKKEEESADTGDNTSESSSLSGSLLDLSLLDNEQAVTDDIRSKPEINSDDLDFMATLEKLTSESYQTQAQAKVPQFKTAIPSIVKEQLQNPVHPRESNDSTVRVGLMTKKGQKQHLIKFMDLPEDTEYVSHWKATEETEKRERSEMMRLTLNMSHRQEREEFEDLVSTSTRSLPAPRQEAMRFGGPPKSNKLPPNRNGDGPVKGTAVHRL